jgi:murein DD-endopeptidase MepM/ murein hydrolase activator NlpD
MDDIVIRPRYPRNNASYRKRKSQIKESNRLAEILKVQFVISLILFTSIIAINRLDTEPAKYIINGIRYVLTNDIRVETIYEKINTWLNIKKNPNIPLALEEDGNLCEDACDSLEEEDRNLAFEFIVPIEGIVVSLFGERLDPVTNELKYHSGIDIETSTDMKIKASESGEVIEVSEHKAYGKYLKIKHSEGVITVYAHCSKIVVSVGTIVDKGQIVAEIGNPDISIGSHLHFEIWVNEVAKNPLEFLKIPVAATNANEIL